MADTQQPDPLIAELIGTTVVVEVDREFTIFGTLAAISEHFLDLQEVDLHCQAEANSSRDIYAMETRDIGIRPNRRRLLVPLAKVLGISRLDDVVP